MTVDFLAAFEMLPTLYPRVHAQTAKMWKCHLASGVQSETNTIFKTYKQTKQKNRYRYKTNAPGCVGVGVLPQVPLREIEMKSVQEDRLE